MKKILLLTFFFYIFSHSTQAIGNKDLNSFLEKHDPQLKASENITVSSDASLKTELTYTDLKESESKTQIQVPLNENKIDIEIDQNRGKVDLSKINLKVETKGGVSVSDSLSLVALYNSTNGDEWTDNTNWLTGPVETWYGLTVFGSTVASIDLASNNLTGTIPQEIGNLIDLQILCLDRNNLTGAIPLEIGNLTSLSTLYLYENELSGEIPSEIGNLTLMTDMFFHYNNLSGAIPSSLGNLTSLIQLGIYKNQLSGTLPASFGNLTSLQYLDLRYNKLSGAIPNEFGSMSAMAYLYLSYNELSGTVPSELNNLANLQRLIINDNLLTNLPDLSSTQMQYLFVEENCFTFGDLDNTGLDFTMVLATFSPQATLELPSVVDNGNGTSTFTCTTDGGGNTYQWYKDDVELTGETNNTLTLSNSDSGVYYCLISNTNYPGLILDTKALFFNTTSYNGIVENEYNILVTIYNNNNGANWNNNTNWLSEEDVQNWYGITTRRGHVTEINLDNNNLTGNIPTELGSLSELTDLYLSNNNLTGNIPAELGNLSKLFYLYLNHNQLIGLMPSQLGNLSKLGYLRLYNNQLEGNIPSEFGGLTNLVGLYINNNKLTGAIPTEINNLPLYSFYIYNNQFTDLPDLSSTRISTFYLFGNKFEFDDLENSGLDFSSITNSYSPQAKLVKPSKTDNGNNTTTLTVTTTGTGDSYQWYSNEGIMTGETTNTITIDNTVESYYYCQISNATYPNLVLETEYVGINISLNHGIDETDYNALIALYNSTNGEDWTNNTNWASAENAQEWYGVTVVNGHVTELNLAENNLTGNIPTEIGSFNSLVILNIDHNEIVGKIPTEIGNLNSLQTLNLWENQLSGEIPTEIGNLTELTVLDIGFNNLSGSIPTSIGNLSKLDQLWLNDNILTGSIPVSFGDLSTLTKLGLNNNKLTGSIPTNIGNLSLLESLYLNKNLLSGTLPVELGNLTNLYMLDLSENLISGSIPSELGNLINLNYFFLNNNELTGAIPTDLGNLTKLYYLYIYKNQLTGSIPSEIGNIPYLMFFAVSDNQLTGSVPAEIGNLSYLDKLYLFNNSFTDLTDLSLTNLSTLIIHENNFEFSDLESTGLDFSTLTSVQYSPQAKWEKPNITDNGNGTTTLTVITTGTGDIYQWFKNGEEMTGENTNSITVDNTTASFYYCIISNSTYPDLVLETEYVEFNMSASHGIDQAEYDALVAFYESTNGTGWTDNTNWVSDVNVQEWFGLTVVDGHITEINLAKNNLSGTLTSELSALDSIVSLNIEHNSIAGEIPSELGNLGNLQVLNLWENQLSGNIPIELGSLSKLKTLDIGYNKLTGNIPSEISSLTNLVDLRFNDNMLSGNIPAEIGNLVNLQFLGLSNNQLTGSIPTELGDLSSLMYLYLNENELSGSLPSELGYLSNVVIFYANNNNLSGAIPADFCNMSNIAILKLENNQLTGSIPNEISNISNLQYLYLYSNQLSGTIPAEIGSCTLLKTISIANNQLTGSIPNEIGNLNSLTFLSIKNNQLSGTLPVELGNLTELTTLSLRFNNFEGAIPTELNNLTKLVSLYLSDNKFTNGIDISSLTSLTTLYINNNELTFGDIENFNIDFTHPGYYYSPQAQLPEPTQTLSGDDVILSFTTDGTGNTYQWYKNSTAIDGETSNTLAIPNTESGIFHCEVCNSNFIELTLSTKALFINSTGSNGITQVEYDALTDFYNSTNGDSWFNNTNWLSSEDVDQWFGITVEGGHVTAIEINYNNISGTIPTSIENLSFLKRFVVTENENGLTGSIPQEIGNLSNLTTLTIYNNSLSGSIPASIGNLANLEDLNLSFNNLEGEIPSEIGNLTKLKTIYLSSNELTGEIPISIGNLENLTSLSIANNNINGGLPSEIGNLININSLSLNGNNLNELPDLSSLTMLENLQLANNSFIFNDFENTKIDFSALSSVNYAPQSDLKMIENYKYLSEGASFTLNCDNLTTESLKSTSNEYAIYKDGMLIQDWSNNPDYIIESFSDNDAGEYTIQVRNAAFEDLVIYTDNLVLGINNKPTDINITLSSINENSVIGTVIGQLSTTDANLGDSFTYSLIVGDGTNDSDNASFTIDGNNLKSASDFNFEVQSEYHIYLQTEDANGLTYSKEFTISVTNINEAPTNITISNLSIDENTSVGSIIGQLTTEDEDNSDTFTYSLTEGNGTNDADNLSFTIENSNLKTAEVFDFETKTEYAIYIKSEDANGLSFEKSFIINVNDITETGIDDNIENMLNVYPNPSKGKFTIELNTDEYLVNIYNQIGNCVYNNIVKDKSKVIDISELPSGTYFIVINYNNKSINKMIVIE